MRGKATDSFTPPRRRRSGKAARIRGARFHSPLAAGALLLLVLFGGASCNRREPPGDSAFAEQPRPGGTLRILHEIPKTLDPVFVDDVYEGAVINQVYEGLVRLDQDLSVIPCMAESWIVSEDGRRYDFQLRPGVRFHDGRPLDADAVVYSFERALRPHEEGQCLAETYLIGIEGARDFREGRTPHLSGLQATGETRVMLRLEEPLSFFLSVLCMDQLKLVPPGAAHEDLEQAPMGTGPFLFVRRRADGGCDLARNPHYWGTPALLDSLSFVGGSMLKADEEVAKLLRHEVDAVAIGSSQRHLVEGAAGFKVRRSPEVSVTFLGLNTSTPPLDRLEVRQAVAMAINRPLLIEKQGGTELEAATGILPPRLAGYQPTPKVLPYDPAAARGLLAAAGYSRAHPLPVIDFYTNVSSTRWLEDELTRQLAEVGIHIRTCYLTWPELDERITDGQAPIFTLTWLADVPDPDSFLYFLFRTGEANNLFAFSDAEVDSLLAVGRRTKPGPDRFAVYRRAESRVLEIAPMIPLYHGGSLYAWEPAVRGVEVNPFGFALTPFCRIWFDSGHLDHGDQAERTP